jgi:cytochrome c oxidase subunit III
VNGGAVVRADALPVLLTGSRSPVWAAMLLLVTIETMVFGTLFASYLYLRFGSAEWPPDGLPAPDLLLPSINTAVLIASAAAVYVAGRYLRTGDVGKLKLWLGTGVLLEIVFFVIKMVETVEVDFRWDAHAYGSIYWGINTFHTAHVVAAILMGTVAWILAMKGFFTDRQRVGIQAVSIYWNFVAGIWIPVYLVLYFVPRWF